MNAVLEKYQLSPESSAYPPTVRVDSQNLILLLTELRENPATYFDMLSCVTGIDNGPEANTMEVIYHLYSIPFHQSLAVKVVLPRENPEIESVCHLWKTAEWHEREAYDLLGIRFKNHPDLRRILLPADWVGHPLRKDYQHQEYYHGVHVAYQAPQPPSDR
ncbi:MAG: NADH-quinone oxidoreductase subunit C [Cyclobacteriaceae bacterium]|jgi:NADH-quinone oxidoreductase subunit C|nr:NADH-quinone oxidoreductase subunit C [Cyclobacteriaceae bacterium]